jgi:tagatose-1,6-bisphosphate aldolase non-catalytic subunit AgaZ/GatZ
MPSPCRPLNRSLSRRAPGIFIDQARVAAEKSANGTGLLYVIGTEVPIPGGETEVLEVLAGAKTEATLQTFDLRGMAFKRLGLEAASERVIGIVVQLSVDFGNSQLFAFDKKKATGLAGPENSLRQH